jgi:carbonic anhydrase
MPPLHAISRRHLAFTRIVPLWMLVSLWGAYAIPAQGSEPSTTPHGAVKKGKVEEESATAGSAKEMGSKLREALGTNVGSKKLTLVMNGQTIAVPEAPAVAPSASAAAAPRHSPPVARTHKARATAPKIEANSTTATTAHGGEVHWAYEGENGPQAWGKLKPEFNVCALGKRQSPISIEDNNTLQGPAEPIRFNYTASSASVVNNGHTIQVDVQGDNSITVRGSNYRLLQFHFHTPSEEQVNYKRYPMVAHLVHKNAEGQLAVVAVLLDTGAENPLVEKVWTYMPLDAGDRVRMPAEMLNLNELLPADQRYYQFIGSLTTPPCTEGVLWMVLKSPMQISKNQFRMFTQLYSNNARPVQPTNGRTVREAQ